MIYVELKIPLFDMKIDQRNRKICRIKFCGFLSSWIVLNVKTWISINFKQPRIPGLIKHDIYPQNMEAFVGLIFGESASLIITEERSERLHEVLNEDVHLIEHLLIRSRLLFQD